MLSTGDAEPAVEGGKNAMKRQTIVLVSLAAFACFADAEGGIAPPKNGRPLRLLIFSGRNNHDWQVTTPLLQSIYEKSGRFAVDVTEDPAACDGALLAKYDAVVDNWSAFPDMTGRQWGGTAEKALLDFVRNGGGFVVMHAATACFADWPEFLALAGSAWRDGAGHGSIHAFPVKVVAPDHPITKGMPDFMTEPEELWHGQTLHPDAKVLCMAFSALEKNGTGQDEPAAVCMRYGRGRCFNSILGHDATAMAGVGWQTLMLRGTEWAATGAVTIPIPDAWPAAGTDSAARKTKAAVITGGHGFEEEPFLALFDSIDTISYDRLDQKDDSEFLEDIGEWRYDVIVFYAMTQNISEQRRQNLLRLLDKGVGVVALHHTAAAFQDWPEFGNIIGVKFFTRETVVDGEEYPTCTYQHDVDMNIRVSDTSHPVTKGIEGFTVHDEVYKGCLFDPDAEVLLTTDHPASDPAVCCVKTYRNARVCYIKPGHGPSVFADASYRRLVAQAIAWTAPRPAANKEGNK